MADAGSLLINIGLKNANKAQDELKGITTGVKDLKSASLEAKAAVLGTIYAFTELTGKQNAFGMALTSFENLTELSGERLQRWQRVMRQVGVTSEETTATISNMHKKLGEVILNKGSFGDGWLAISNKVGQIDMKRLAAGDAFYMLDLLKQYAKLTKGQGIAAPARVLMNAAGLSDNFIAGLNNPNLKNPNQAEAWSVYNKREQKGLTQGYVGFDTLEDKWSHAFGRLSAAVSPELAKDLNDISDGLIKLGEAVGGLAKALAAIPFVGYLGKKAMGVEQDWLKAETTGAKFIEAMVNSPKLRDMVMKDLGTAISKGASTVHNSLQPNTTITVNGVDANNAAAVGAAVSVEINRAFRQLNSNGAVGGN